MKVLSGKVSKAEDVVDSLIPETEARTLCLSVFRESLIEANKYGANKWGAYYTNDKVRLLVGSLIVLTIEKRGVWVTLDKQLFEKFTEELHLLEISNDWHWDTGLWSEYKAVPSKNGYYFPSNDHSQIWPVIRRLHFSFIEQAAKKYAQLRENSKHENMPNLLAYLRYTLNLFVPEPVYEDSKSRRYWLWVARPEYYEEVDGSDLEILEQGVISDGWWTCNKNTKKGDLILLYRAKKRYDIAHIIQAKSNADPLDRDDYAREMGWTYGCSHMTIRKLKHPITLQDLRENDQFFKESWGAYRSNFQGIVFEIPSDVWDKLILIAEQKNPSYDLELLLDQETTKELNNLKSMVKSDLDSLRVEESGQDYYTEGKPKPRYTIHYERNQKLRAKAIEIHGTKCKVCGFDFGAVYGERGYGYIEVHHLIPVSSFGETTKVDPRTDMTVVCSNCHRMIHRKKDHVLSPSEVKECIEKSGR